MELNFWTILPWLLAAVGVAGGVYFKASGKGEESDYFGTLGDAQNAAREAVAAAEQLWRTGQIPETATGEKDPRFEWALDRLQALFPDLDENTLEMTIEASVFWLKSAFAKAAATAASTPEAEG